MFRVFSVVGSHAVELFKVDVITPEIMLLVIYFGYYCYGLLFMQYTSCV
jgi:hypothetical protein